jgi:hypothetical protein
MNPDYQAMPLKEIFVLKKANALRIAEIKEMIRLTYQDALLLNVEDLSPAEWMRYQHTMHVCRSIRALVENDFGMLYAALAIQDEKFEQIEALQASLL